MSMVSKFTAALIVSAYMKGSFLVSRREKKLSNRNINVRSANELCVTFVSTLMNGTCLKQFYGPALYAEIKRFRFVGAGLGIDDYGEGATNDGRDSRKY